MSFHCLLQPCCICLVCSKACSQCLFRSLLAFPCVFRLCLAETVVQLESDCKVSTNSVPPAARSGVSQMAASVGDYALAWKDPPTNTLLGWGGEGDERSSAILRTLLGAKLRTPLTSVAQISAAPLHALILVRDGSLKAGFSAPMKDWALPKPGTIQGRLVRISAAGDSDTDTNGGYSLGIVSSI
jgi:hypothetical protein